MFAIQEYIEYKVHVPLGGGNMYVFIFHEAISPLCGTFHTNFS